LFEAEQNMFYYQNDFMCCFWGDNKYGTYLVKKMTESRTKQYGDHNVHINQE